MNLYIESILKKCEVILNNKENIVSDKCYNEELKEINFTSRAGVCTNIDFKEIRRITLEDLGYKQTDLSKQILEDIGRELSLCAYISMMFALDNPDITDDIPLHDYDCYPIGGEDEFDKNVFGKGEFWHNPRRFEFTQFIYDVLRDYYLDDNLRIDDRLITKAYNHELDL